MVVGFVTFKSAEQVKTAVEVLPSFQWAWNIHFECYNNFKKLFSHI